MEKGILKKASAVALALASVMAVSLIPVMGTMTNSVVGQVEAKAAEVISSGTCGATQSWILDDAGTLTITGSGDMADFSYDKRAPWYDNRSKIKTVQIDDRITGLGAYAFCDCNNLSNVKIPKSITLLKESVFEDCDSLKNITIPSSITSIDDYAFYDCDGLEKIYIPDGVTSISSYAFDECSNIRKISVSDNNLVYDSRESSNAIIETSENTLIRGCMNTIIPAGVSGDTSAFSGCSLERVLIGSGLSNVSETDVEVSSQDTTILGVAGTYIADPDAALARINEIRREACDAGWINPATGQPLTSEDYVPISWSYDLEYIARIRATESALTIAHERTNGSRWSVIVGPNGERSWGEVLAWNGTDEILSGIDQWYDEKDDWVNQNPDAVTGHYTQMIDPTNLYVGLGAFCSARTWYPNCTAGEFSTGSDLDDSQIDMSGDCIQKLEVSNDVISDPVICGFLENTVGETEHLTAAVDVEYPVEDEEGSWQIDQLIVLDDIVWTSADESIVSIDEDGIAHANAPGKTTITADLGGGITVTEDYRVLFKDVTDAAQFYYDPVYWMSDEGITTGWTDGTFRPWNTCNRAAVVTFLWRMAGRPEPQSVASFKDMPADTSGNKDFRMAISWAVEEGITTGWADNTFRPWNTCNRAAIMTFIWRYAGEPKAGKPSVFKDKTGNSDFDAAIAWASENEISTGWTEKDGSSTFRPWNNCNRASVSAFLYRYAHE